MKTDSHTYISEKPSPFARDLVEGLTSSPKKLYSRYFYDDRGSELFEQIMHLEAYYPTRTEHEIFELHKEAILQAFTSKGASFELLEFGAGDGWKTKVLLSHFLERHAHFAYHPIDISGAALEKLEISLREEFPDLDVHGLQGEYFTAMDKLIAHKDSRKIVFFLGSNIGNFERERALAFLQEIQRHLNPGDLLFIGFDLKKDPEVILRAYNDPEGVTREFNLNLLRRINREFDANFNLQQFRHWASYDPITGRTKSFLVSKTDQTVRIEGLQLEVSFNAWEAIDMELSQKYDLDMIHDLARSSGFKVTKDFFDSQRYFVDSLWEKG